MKPLIQFLSDLRATGVSLSISGERLICNAPKNAITAAIRSELAARKGEIVAFLRQSEPWTAAPRNSDKGDELPLSRSQELVWFVAQLDPGHPVYNINIPLSLKGTLDRNALEVALKSVILRHESLRTGFYKRNGKPFARIVDGSAWKMDYVDLTHLEPTDAEAEVKGLAHAAGRWPFDLEKPPLIRATLFHVSRDRYLLIIVVQHIAADGWSLGILYREMTEVYAAIASGHSAHLPDLSLQYRDFVHWEQEVGQEAADQQIAYWMQRLGGELPVLELPLDKPRPPKLSYNGSGSIVEIDPGFGENLRKLSRETETTLFVVLAAAYKVLMLRYTGLEDILLGSNATIRPRQDFAPLIGLFVNNVVLRTDLSGNPTFLELVTRVSETTRSAYANQNVTFDQLLKSLHPERSLSRSPIIQSVFSLQNVPLAKLRLPGLEVDFADIDIGIAGGDLGAVVWPNGDGYTCIFGYSTDLFEEETVEQIKRHYIRLLREIVANPNCRIGELPLLSEEERGLITRDWNRTESSGCSYKTVPEWFRAQARATPHGTAVVMGERTLTYSQLDEQSEALARTLRSMGVGQETVVGLHVNRSPEMIVGLLGILKAGGAYLPLDPAFPAKRIGFLLNDAGASLILTQAALRDALPQTGSTLLDIDEVLAVSDRPSIAEPDRNPEPADLAYLIYTSGSTGEPKGTEIQHCALVNLLWSMLKEPGLQSSDTLVAVTTLSFDISGLEIFGPLLCGARVVLASREQTLDPLALAELLEQVGATVLQATPSSWRMLVDAGWLGKPDLRIWCGGEALSPGLADSLLERGWELWNLYGPTETTIWSAAHRVSSGEDPILIGRPIANTRMYILDRLGEPVPAGVTGELYIAGAGVARGYRNRPELNMDCFLADSFGEEGRMYRTGDRGRYRRDGQIQLVGRADQQIKLRGHRIELGEIEMVLERLSSVQQAAVSVQGEGAGQHLVAYVRPAAEAPQAAELRRLLLESLPEYMVPASFVFLNELPLTPNGKVDRKRLPIDRHETRERTTEVEAPRNSTEKLIAAAWSEVLRENVVSMEDNFFDLGGHSILLVQVLAILREEFDVPLAVVDLFRYPTIQSLAAYLERQGVPELAPGVYR